MSEKQQQQQQQYQAISNSNSYLTGTNYDTLSLKMEQTLSEVASLDSGVSHVDCNASSMSNETSSNSKQLWNFQLQLWILVTSLFIKLGQISEAEVCIEGTTGMFGNLSHQLMFLRGMDK